MLNVLVPKPSLQGASIVASVRQGKAATVPQHVRMDGERQASALANPRKQSMKGFGRHRPTALRREDVRGCGLFAL
jgi:hypothetical protein